ncbi:hypothetical protein BU597_00485 [Staphylococcus arlettae]|nr:hypothetical protein BU605_11145 [Staphylococcus arlettae]PTH55376.1 hypothetical protein BU597_00485 [Staphylococcus arlettae]RIM58697.1 hypothetical protein BU598_09910 [Staphylococcus arlettae]
MNKSKIYVIIVLTICLLIMTVCLPLLIKNGSYSAIFSAFIPIAIVIIYLIFNKRTNNDNED